MKKEITDRIRLLGGNVANLKGNSLKEDLCAITFDTALFLKPVDTPWLAAEDTEPIEGLGDWVDEHMELFNSDREAFYKEMTDRTRSTSLWTVTMYGRPLKTAAGSARPRRVSLWCG